MIAKNQDGWNPLHILCRHQHINHDNLLQLIPIMIESNSDVLKTKTRERLTSFQHLCRYYEHDKLNELVGFWSSSENESITQQQHVNARAPDGWTPLHFVCQYYRGGVGKLIELVRLLIEKGANVNASTSDGWTPLHILCSSYIHNDLNGLVELLIDNNREVITAETSEGLKAHYMLKYWNPNKSKFSNVLHILEG